MWWQKVLINIALYALDKIVKSVATEFSEPDAKEVKAKLRVEKSKLDLKEQNARDLNDHRNKR